MRLFLPEVVFFYLFQNTCSGFGLRETLLTPTLQFSPIFAYEW